MAVPMISSATGVTFGGFPRRVALFCVAGVALRDIQTCFVTCRKMSKAVLCGRRNTFVSFSEDALQFSWQAPSLDMSIFILRGRRSTLEESCCVVLRIALSGLR